MGTRVVSATEFKAKCSALLDEVEESRETITITKRGRPVAVVSPAKQRRSKSFMNSWAKKGRIVGDIVSPIMKGWECVGDE